MNGYRSPAPRQTDTDDVVAFLRDGYLGPERSTIGAVLRVVPATLVMLVALYFWCFRTAAGAGVVAVYSLPPFQRWWIRRRLRRAGLLAELAEYDAARRKP